jgi:methyl halide transferase
LNKQNLLGKLTLDERYWSARYENGTDGWNVKTISNPLKVFFDQLLDKDQKILIPGCGYAHEAEYLLMLGFTNINIVDISETICGHLVEKFENTGVEVLNLDIFDVEGQYDLIIEQTMFCALDPSLRAAYLDKIAHLLRPAGSYIGLLFASHFEKHGPPFGGNIDEYLKLFSTRFQVITLEPCYNSIASRAGNELWINLKPK